MLEARITALAERRERLEKRLCVVLRSSAPEGKRENGPSAVRVSLAETLRRMTEMVEGQINATESVLDRIEL